MTTPVQVIHDTIIANPAFHAVDEPALAPVTAARTEMEAAVLKLRANVQPGLVPNEPLRREVAVHTREAARHLNEALNAQIPVDALADTRHALEELQAFADGLGNPGLIGRTFNVQALEATVARLTAIEHRLFDRGFVTW